MSTQPLLPPLTEAALGYARRGWPVFPCNPKNKQPLLAADKDRVTGKPIKGTGGVSKATCDEEQVKAWWKRWPNAMIGLAMGHNGLFALDFDPRTEDVIDEATGEVLETKEWTLEQLKAETEAQIGCELPVTLAARTPSGGVHLYLHQPKDGDPIRNRGNLPQHVDVRGKGGYVIAPPSEMEDGRRYRWLHGNWDAEISDAPASLVDVLRRPKAKASPQNEAAGDKPASASSLPRRSEDPAEEAVRRYALSAFDAECQELAKAPMGDRNNQINARAFALGQLVGAGALSEAMVRSALQAVVAGFGVDYDKCCQSIENGLSAGMAQPRDLNDVAENARRRQRYGPSRSSRAASSPHRPAPPGDAQGRLSSQRGARPANDRELGSGGPSEADVTRECAFKPLTDLGNLERFLERHGRNFLYVEQWGWLAWDGKRWNRDMAMALLGHAVQRTMRAIQAEAAMIRESGVPPPDEAVPVGERGKDWMLQQMVSRRVSHDGPRLDSIVQIKKGGEIVLLSDKVAAWGRTSEGAGHINCIAKLAEARLSARPSDFDADPLLLNMQSGTLVFLRPGDGFPASVREREHRREDRITKIAEAHYDARATCPQFDAFLKTVQPAEDMRDFLDTWAGYNALGLADAQKMALFYGEGSNGKGVWINTVAYILGDYAWATGIETFMDQGKYRKGSDASPDLAALAGRRMVHANEPEDNSKFSDGLIKALTSDEPKGGVRELMKPPFQLEVTFKNTVMANNMPKIGTDHGIQRRVQVVPWEVIIPDEQQDLRLKDKLKAEASGVLNRMIAGALRYLTEGLSLPEAVKAATLEYQQENDLLGRFLDLCVARVEGATVGATPLHRVFAAWQTWAGQLNAAGKSWSAKYLNAQMKRKSFKIAKSSTMQWQNIALRYSETDFTDHEGRAVERELPPPRTFDGEGKAGGAARPPSPPPIDDDDDLPRFDDGP